MTEQPDKRDIALKKISNNPTQIVKGNPIIFAKFEISAIQMKIYLHMISKLDVSKSNFEEMTISVQEFAKFTGIESNDLYKIVRNESVKLMEKKIYYEDDKITLDTVLVSSVQYNKKQGTYSFEFPKKLAPFLLQLKENFTTYDLKNVFLLESAYSIRFFEFCKKYENLKKFSFGVEELKTLFGLSVKYKNYFDFKKNVIQQAEKELKENCELYFSFKEKKVGKRVTDINFFIHSNTKKLNRQADSTEQESEQPQENTAVIEIFEIVQNYVTKDTVQKWLKKYPYEQVRAGVLYSLQELKAGKVKDMAKYLQTMVKTQSLFHEQEQAKKQQEEKRKKKQETEKIQQTQQELENEKKSLQANFFQSVRNFFVKTIEQDENLYRDILQNLREEHQQEKKPFLVELAFDNYKPIEGVKIDSKEEFLGNYLKMGSFSSYIHGVMRSKYSNEYEDLKKTFESKAKELNVRLD